MTQQPIVVGFDDSPASREALKWALRDARGRRCEVLLVHAAKTFPPILPGPGGYVAYPSQITAEAGKAVLQAGALLADRLAPEVTTTTLLIEDEPRHAMLRHAHCPVAVIGVPKVPT